MSIATSMDVADVPALSHTEAMSLAEAEYLRFADLLDALTARQWATDTSCPGWAVREIAGHVLGSMQASASPREQRRQLRAAQNTPGPVADGLTATQIASTAALTADEVRRQVRQHIPAAVRGRRRVPAPLRRLIPVPTQLPVSGAAEKWPLGYLLDQVLTRDVWMHRSDITAATGLPFLATADHDARIVALVVADWAQRHQQPFRLTLHGPAGGQFHAGRPQPGTDVTDDAIEFCRALSGRSAVIPLETEVPF